MFGISSERSLIPTVIPPMTAHINPVISFAFRTRRDLMRTLQGWLTIITDGFLKTTGRSDLTSRPAELLPLPPFNSSAAARALGLTCLTANYEKLWDEFNTSQTIFPWSKSDPRLAPHYFDRFKSPWNHHSALRTDFERRQAQLELDVLCAQALGVTLEDLCALYRIQFPVFRMYENDTWYDQKGRIIFSRKNGEGPIAPKEKIQTQNFRHQGKKQRNSVRMGRCQKHERRNRDLHLHG